MFLDSLLQFSSAQAVTAAADSTNVIDLGANRDMGVGRTPLFVGVFVTTTFTHATGTATMNVALQGAPNNGGVAGTYNAIGQSVAVPLGQMYAGQKIAQFVVPSISQGIATPVVTTAETTASSATMTVASATGLKAGMAVYGGQGTPGSASVSGIVPGTTISSISGTTVTLSTAATVTNAAGTYFSFVPAIQLPRFLKLVYTPSTGSFSAGALSAYLSPDLDQYNYYPPGFTVAN
jgi:hypothetical protein